MTNKRGSGRQNSSSPRLRNFKFNPERKRRAWFRTVRRRDLVNAATILGTSLICAFLISIGGPYSPSLATFGGLFLMGIAAGVFLLTEFPKTNPENVKNLQLLRLAGLTIAGVIVGLLFLSLGWSAYLIPLPMLTAIATIAFGRRLAVLHSWSLCGALGVAVARWPTHFIPEHPPLPLIDVTFLFAMGSASTVMAYLCDKIMNRGTLLRAGLLSGLVIFMTAVLGRAVFELPDLNKSYKRYQNAVAVKGLLDKELTRQTAHGEAVGKKTLIERSKAVKAIWREYLEVFGFSFWGFINCAFSGFFLYEILRWVERVFGVITRLHLVQLADLNEPLLRRLNMETPGTYHHCQMVAQLAEAAAEEIGADNLLVRVGAYYHDIGKMAKPRYFTENNPFSSENHGRLTPTLSTLIIHAHVKDGIELARSLNLPQKVIDFIPEHHGTTACEFFYRQAVDRAREKNQPIPNKEIFRYPGPRPRSKETAIILIADSVEAATRSLKNPSPGRIRTLVHEIVIDKLLDHQFDDCPLNLGELSKVEETFVRKLTWMHHARIRYPEKIRSGQEARLKKLDRQRREESLAEKPIESPQESKEKSPKEGPEVLPTKDSPAAN
jgi:cyclic-di-AMP phosphodiesterase PgpH